MIHHIRHVLSPEEIAESQRLFDVSRATSLNTLIGWNILVNAPALVPPKVQQTETELAARQLNVMVRNALTRTARFKTIAMPRRIRSPIFFCNEGDPEPDHTLHFHAFSQRLENFENYHEPMRDDLLALLFLSHPNDYDGGDITIEDPLPTMSFRYEAGDMAIFPNDWVYSLAAVTRGKQLFAFFEIESSEPNVDIRNARFVNENE